MTNLTTKRLPRSLSISRGIPQVPPNNELLRWRVPAKNGAKSFNIDLTEFAVGDVENGIPSKLDLISQLAPEIQNLALTRAEKSMAQVFFVLRVLWRFLGLLEKHGAPGVDVVENITPAIGVMFKNYLVNDLRFAPQTARRCLKDTRVLVEAARKRMGIVPTVIMWPTIQLGRGVVHKDVDPASLRRLYHAAKAVLRRFAAAYQEGQQLLTQGADPRLVVRGRNQFNPAWRSRPNIAWLAHHYLEEILLNRLSGSKDPAPEFFKRPRLVHIDIMPQGYEGRPLFDRYRWFAPRAEDVTAAATLVLLHTGWNVETVFSIDVSSRDSWCQERLESDAGETVALYGNKGRTHHEQVAFSLTRPQFHPYRVIEDMISRTALLRDELRRRLEEIRREPLSEDRLDRELILEKAISSPWLFLRETLSSELLGRVGVLAAGKSGTFQPQFQLLVKAAEVNERLTPSDLRDGFASFIYDNSLFNILLVKRALGHQNLSSTKHYLRQRRMLAQRFADYAAWSNGIFDEIKRFQVVDPTILYIRARFGDISDEQRKRLANHRLRTRVGMGCLDPEHPPSTIAPMHEGGICGVQRCILCRHGVVFEDSFDLLARRVAELQVIRGHTPFERWEASSFQAEWLAIESTVARCFEGREEEFEALIGEHVERLECGNSYLFDEIGAGDLHIGVSR